MKAYCLIRPLPHYRHDAFLAGLKAAGYEVSSNPPADGVHTGDVLVQWNRYGQYGQFADRFERQGGLVIVAENGYIGRDENGVQMYALACHGHNGSGKWHVGGPERFKALNVEVKPWRAAGDKIVIRGQRGIGNPKTASPPNWHNDIAARLSKLTKRKIQVIQHPGNGAVTDTSHEQYLQGAHALVIWSSSVGVKALVAGIPVFQCSPYWVCAGASSSVIDEIESPKMDDAARLVALERMAWAQCSVGEISTGEPFVRLRESA